MGFLDTEERVWKVVLRNKAQLLDPVIGEGYMRENEALFFHLKELFERAVSSGKNQALDRVKGKETIKRENRGNILLMIDLEIQKHRSWGWRGKC